ncbi:hypothetical protein QR680_009728 [Steinernema hermaphroditum]|uniref:Carboxylic ester hydrolase n=1 Tax=Steinernema hermaphroditum TaxID=289476 RepID=A0AA39ILF6_9BILA|nr:hypothetical protein QR680_009728 [Steinernema hermaphroditum]
MYSGDGWTVHAFLLLSFAATIASTSTVDTPYGQIQGFESGSANVFLGIRYAKAPVGDLRLEKPRRVDPWSSPMTATSFGATCFPEFRRSNFQNFPLSEDCLFLNVFSPQTPPKASLLPVMVFFHGGAFMRGSSTELGVDGIVKNFVSRGVVFVTVNYRLSLLSFVTTEDNVLPGNLAFWDQTSALLFIKDIISGFGGNPDDITIAGSSAGAASVSALTLSPYSNRLFQKAIQISGSAFAYWAVGSPVGEQSRLLFEALRCRGNSTEIKRCLKEKTIDEILNVTEAMGRRYDQIGGIRYLPRMDGEFFPSDFKTLVGKAPRIPTISGVADTDAGPFVFANSNRTFITVTEPNRWNYTREEIEKVFTNFNSMVPGLKPLLEGFYLKEDNDSSTFYLSKLVDLASDLAFNIPCHQESSVRASNNWPVYLFVEEFYDDESPRDEIPIEGSFHTNEMAYLFDVKPAFLILPEPKPGVGEEFKKNMLDGFISFVRTGFPRVGNVAWLPISVGKPFRYMNFNETSSMREGFFEESVQFWTKFVPRRVDGTALRSVLPNLESGRKLMDAEPAKEVKSSSTIGAFATSMFGLLLAWLILN